MTAGRPIERFDVVVAGGGSAGVAAAVGAARAGASVCLVERFPFLGGAAITSSVLSYCGFFDQRRERVVGGVGEELLARLRTVGACEEITFKWSGNTVVLVEPEWTKSALDALVADAGVTTLLHSRLVGVHGDGELLREVVLADHGGTRIVEAAAFVDATGEGDLADGCGAAVTVAPPGERQVGTLSMRIVGLGDDAVISSEAMRAAVAAYNAVHEPPLGRDHGPAARLPLTGELLMQIVDEPVDALDGADMTRAEVTARVRAREYLTAFREHIDGWEGAQLAATGPQIGVRESRHLVGRATVVRDDVLRARRRPDDGIARCGWPIEEHPGVGATRYTPIDGRAFYDIPLAALRSVDRDNVWAGGRLVSCDADAYASLRVMGTAFATGQAAGVAAARSAAGEDPDDATAVRSELARQGALV